MKDEINTTDTALVAIEPNQIATAFTEGNVDPILIRIKEEVALHTPDVSTRKGRDAIKSLAYKVARSKTLLDEAGKELTAEAQKQIDQVNVERRKIRETLDELKQQVRKPLEVWETAEEERKAALRERMKVFDKDRTHFNMASSEITAVITEVEAVEVEEGWDELMPMAVDAKADALTKYRVDLDSAEVREQQQRQIEKLKQEAAEREAREAEERQAREAKEAEERQAREQKEAEERAAREEQARIEQEKQARIQQEEAERQRLAEERAAKQQAASDIMDHISGCGAGKIGPDDQPLGLIQYELEKKIPPEIEKLLDEDRKRVEQHRLATLEIITHRLKVAEEEAERQRAAERERAEKEAAERALKEAAERQAEAERKEAEELEKRKADQARRDQMLKEVTAALAEYPIEEMAQAICDGKIPHVQMVF